jgi:hypothetical protein
VIETEEQWLTGTEPFPLLAYLRETATPRKLRLFACACVRQVWPALIDEVSQRSVELAERFADGLADASELEAVHTQAAEVAHLADLRTAASDPAWAATRAASRVSDLGDPFRLASGATFLASISAAPWAFDLDTGAIEHRGDPDARALARKDQADLVREVFANPFREVRLDPAVLAWDGGTLARLARSLYAERRFAELPVLADALEEAGCTDTSILDHLRQRAGHVPGCWALDVVLGLGST